MIPASEEAAMPQYLYPGVYVEEVSTGVSSIPGVSTSSGKSLDALASDLRRTIGAYAPDWTDVNESDPGVTLVQVFAFLAENLLYRTDAIPQRGRDALTRASAALAALGFAGDAGAQGLTRPRYFPGRILDAATLTAEQDYVREKLRRHNRALVGSGVVSGLAVHVAGTGDPNGPRVVVDPGYAIDANGEEISVPRPVVLAPPPGGDPVYVTVRYFENPCPPIPSLVGETPEAPCVEEACVVAIGPDASAPAIPLARLVYSESTWSVDPVFAPPRVSGRA
jgi:hypothetical protein